MGNIVQFPGNTCIPESAESFLNKAKEWEADSCIVIGLNKNEELLFGGNLSEVGEIILLLEMAKKFIVDNHFKIIP